MSSLPANLVFVASDHPRLRLHASHILGVGSTEVVVLIAFQRREHPTLNQLMDDLLRLMLRTVANEDATRSAQLNLFGDESLDLEGEKMEVALNYNSIS